MPWLDDPDAEAAKASFRAEEHTVQLEVADARPPEYSDESLALRFAGRHANTARYVAAWGRWLLWDTARWQFDNTLEAFDLARNICRIASAEITDEKQSKLAAAVASKKTVAAVASLARADRRHAAAIEQWDRDPWLIFARGASDDRS